MQSYPIEVWHISAPAPVTGSFLNNMGSYADKNAIICVTWIRPADDKTTDEIARLIGKELRMQYTIFDAVTPEREVCTVVYNPSRKFNFVRSWRSSTTDGYDVVCIEFVPTLHLGKSHKKDDHVAVPMNFGVFVCGAPDKTEMRIRYHATVCAEVEKYAFPCVVIGKLHPLQRPDEDEIQALCDSNLLHVSMDIPNTCVGSPCKPDEVFMGNWQHFNPDPGELDCNICGWRGQQPNGRFPLYVRFKLFREDPNWDPGFCADCPRAAPDTSEL